MPAWLGWDWVEQNLVWSLIWSAVGALMATILATKALNVLTDNKKVIWFFVCSLLGIFALSILFGRGQVAAKQNLTARVESLMWGGASNPPNPLKSPVFTVVSIRNTGPMASIADDYKLILNVGGRTYTGTLQAVDKF